MDGSLAPLENLPFRTHEELVDGLRRKRYLIAVRDDPRSIQWFPTVSQRLLQIVLIYSPILLAIGFTVRAAWTRQPWLLLAWPLCLRDFRVATGLPGLWNLVYWLLWWLAAALLSFVSRPLAHALFVIPPWFLLTQIAGNTGKGVTFLQVRWLVEQSEHAFDWFYSRGIIALFDTTTKRWYGHPSAMPPGTVLCPP
jgi:hypothetical protein